MTDAERREFLARMDAAYADLRSDPEAWRDEEVERRAWEATLMDGIEVDEDGRRIRIGEYVVLADRLGRSTACKVVEYRGRLGPGGCEVWRLRLPNGQPIEVTRDQIAPVVDPGGPA